MYQNFIIPYLYEAQHVLGNTLPIIRSLKLHWQPLVFHIWKVVGRAVGGRCQAFIRFLYDLYVYITNLYSKHLLFPHLDHQISATHKFP